MKNPETRFIKGTEHGITLVSSKPVFCKPYGIPYNYLPLVKQEINELEKKDIIQNSKSAYSTPIFVTLKRNGKIRLIHDYVRLNHLTVKDGYPFPNIFDQVQGLTDMKVFTVLDLDRGFYQIPIKPEDCHKTAFSVPFGHFEYKRLPFGLCNAPRNFHRIMDTLLAGCKAARTFVDDISIISHNAIDHVIDVREVLEKLDASGAKVNSKKVFSERLELNI